MTGWRRVKRRMGLAHPSRMYPMILFCFSFFCFKFFLMFYFHRGMMGSRWGSPTITAQAGSG